MKRNSAQARCELWEGMEAAHGPSVCLQGFAGRSSNVKRGKPRSPAETLLKAARKGQKKTPKQHPPP